MRWLRRPWSFRTQIVLLTAGVTAVAMLLLSVVLQVLLARVTNDDVDRVLEDRARSITSSVGTDRRTATLTVPDSLLDPGVAVFDATGALVAGSTPLSLRRTYEELAETRTARVIETRGPSRVRAQPFVTADGTSGVVVVTESVAPYEEAERLALIVILVTGLVTTAVAAAIAAWTTRRALRPVTEMARTASDWSEHDLGRRFALGESTGELGALAGTLDHLLDKVAAAIRSEQRLTAELAHELRTPLTTIQGTADLMLMRDGGALPGPAREDLREIAAASRRMAGTITTLLDLARSEATAGAAQCRLADAVADVVSDLQPGAVAVEVDLGVAGDATLALPGSLAARTLAPVVENAVRHATSRVRVSSAVREGRVEVLVRDDGPGVSPDVAHDLFEPGRSAGGGTGLGLAISRRIARAAGGDVDHLTDTDHAPGARFVVRLPLA